MLLFFRFIIFIFIKDASKSGNDILMIDVLVKRLLIYLILLSKEILVMFKTDEPLMACLSSECLAK